MRPSSAQNPPRAPILQSKNKVLTKAHKALQPAPHPHLISYLLLCFSHTSLPRCCPDLPGMSSPQGLCTSHSLCLTCSSPKYPQGLPSHCFQYYLPTLFKIVYLPLQVSSTLPCFPLPCNTCQFLTYPIINFSIELLSIKVIYILFSVQDPPTERSTPSGQGILCACAHWGIPRA